ncbi:MAG: amidohydrolase [Vibrio sp.]
MGKNLWTPLSIATLLTLAGCNDDSSDSDSKVEADTVFYNGNVLTMDDEASKATSVAVKDGKIVALNVPIDDYSAQDTELINLNSKTLIPGFIDAHGHMSMVAQYVNYANLSPSPIGTSDSIPQLIQVMQDFWQDKELADGQWIVGTGYDDSLLAEKTHPTRYDLDQISTETPIVILHVSAHLAVVNSKGLELLGIDDTTPDPDGGKIVRVIGTNTPNGVLEESAMYPAMAGFSSGPSDTATMIETYKAAQKYYASFGITTVQEGAAAISAVRTYDYLADNGELFLDIVAYPTWDNFKMLDLEGYKVSKNYESNFRIGGVKFILDGSPQGKTAYMTQPYLNPPAGQAASYVGYPSLTQEDLQTKLRELLDKKVQFIAHANGDAAADMYLDALGTIVTEQDNMVEIRPVAIHSQTIRDDQLERMIKFSMIPSFFSAHTFFWGDWHRDEVFGEERAQRISPTRSASNLNIKYTTHNDAPVVDPDIIRLMYNTVNRVTRSGQTLGEEQKATPYEALESVTRNAAYQYFEEDSKGSIEIGKLADLVILSDDPLTIDPTKINTISVLETFKNGVSVYKQ